MSDTETYLSESEARLMVNGFNKHLSQSFDHLDQLKAKENHLSQKLAHLVSLNQSTSSDIESKREQTALLTSNNTKNNLSLSVLREKLEIEEFPGHENTEKLIKFLVTLKQANAFLSEEQIFLKERIQRFEDLEAVQKQCTRCHNKYTSKDNHMELCQFHPGKLRYYSCKRCNADAYYTCCMMCSDCSIGCKNDQHIS